MSHFSYPNLEIDRILNSKKETSKTSDSISLQLYSLDCLSIVKVLSSSEYQNYRNSGVYSTQSQYHVNIMSILYPASILQVLLIHKQVYFRIIGVRSAMRKNSHCSRSLDYRTTSFVRQVPPLWITKAYPIYQVFSSIGEIACQFRHV